MIIKIKFNKETLEWESEDQSVTVNHILVSGDDIEIEVSKPDPEIETH
jgi:hypothetical protein